MLRLTASAGLLLLASSFAASADRASAETAFSVYGGYQTAPHSPIEINGADAFTAGWEGRSFNWPAYWGARATYWLDRYKQPNLGIALDFSHAKVYADDATLAKSGWSHFEFTDGLNLLTLNALYRFPIKDSKWTPYVGLGAGINVPHVEVTRPSGRTYDYQFGGPTVQAQAGVSYNFAKNWDAFVEYKANYSWVDVKIDSGDRMKTGILTNSVNFGIGFRF